MREPLPPRYWRKVVAATQGIVLTIAAADVLPLASDPSRPRRRACPACRVVRPRRVVAVAPPARNRTVASWTSPSRACAETRIARGRSRSSPSLLVWAALVAPDQPSRLHARRVPAAPGRGSRRRRSGPRPARNRSTPPGLGRRAGSWSACCIVKILNLGFFATFDRPFDPVGDWSYTGIGIETMRDSIGATGAEPGRRRRAVLCVAVLVLMTLAVLRLTRVAAVHRRWSLQAVAALGVVWVLCWAFGAQLVSGAPVASTSAADLAVDEVRAVQAGLEDNAMFAERDQPRPLPQHPRQPAADRPARQGRPARVRRELRQGRGPGFLLLAQGRCGSRQGHEAAAGRRLLLPERLPHLVDVRRRSAGWRTPRMHSGLWVDSQRRYYQLVKTDRFTLSRAFKRAGWRTVDDVPSNNRPWPQGSSFYHYDKVYDRRNVGYRGPTFAYASMPDQYVLAALQRLELSKRVPPSRLRGGRPGVEPRAVDPHPPARSTGATSATARSSTAFRWTR